MAVSITIDVHNTVVSRLLRSRVGPLARHMLTRGARVQRAAQRRINSRTGTLARSITVDTVRGSDGGVGVRIGSSLSYAKFVHDGTGIYGPSRRPIRPTRRKALAFDGVVVANVRGQRGTRFLIEALDAAR